MYITEACGYTENMVPLLVPQQGFLLYNILAIGFKLRNLQPLVVTMTNWVRTSTDARAERGARRGRAMLASAASVNPHLQPPAPDDPRVIHGVTRGGGAAGKGGPPPLQHGVSSPVSLCGLL